MRNIEQMFVAGRYVARGRPIGPRGMGIRASMVSGGSCAAAAALGSHWDVVPPPAGTRSVGWTFGHQPAHRLPVFAPPAATPCRSTRTTLAATFELSHRSGDKAPESEFRGPSRVTSRQTFGHFSPKSICMYRNPTWAPYDPTSAPCNPTELSLRR